MGCPGLKTITKHLPQRHSKGPDIGGRGKLEKIDALRSTPGNRKLQVDVEIGLIVVLADPQGPGQAKVGDFDNALGKDENVAGSQVTMDQPLRLQVLHALANLTGKVGQTSDTERAPKTRLLQALEQGPQRSQLGDEHDLIVWVQDHAVKPDNVRMVDRLHDVVLLHKLEGVVLHPLFGQTLDGHLVSHLVLVSPYTLLDDSKLSDSEFFVNGDGFDRNDVLTRHLDASQG